jgi:hypothetical protein
LDWYGPNDEWPRHGKQHFRDALSYARDAGWWFGKYEGHSFGLAVCDQGLPKGTRCEFLIFSTGEGSESNARTLRSRVDRCPHKGNAADPSAVTQATQLLDEADLLIDAALACLAATNKQARVAELLDLAAHQADAADTMLEEAVELDDAVGEHKTQAYGLAEAAGYPAHAPLAPEPLLDNAEDRAVTAQIKVRKPGASQTRRRVQQRARRTIERITSIRGQFT